MHMRTASLSLVPGLFEVWMSSQHHSKQNLLNGPGHPDRLKGMQETTFFSLATKPVHCSVNSSSIF